MFYLNVAKVDRVWGGASGPVHGLAARREGMRNAGSAQDMSARAQETAQVSGRGADTSTAVTPESFLDLASIS